MKLEIHMDNKILRILAAGNPAYGDDENHLTEPVFENVTIVEWLSTNKIEAKVTIDDTTNMVDIDFGGEENEAKFTAFVASCDELKIPEWGDTKPLKGTI